MYLRTMYWFLKSSKKHKFLHLYFLKLIKFSTVFLKDRFFQADTHWSIITTALLFDRDFTIHFLFYRGHILDFFQKYFIKVIRFRVKFAPTSKIRDILLNEWKGFFKLWASESVHIATYSESPKGLALHL